MGNNKRTINSLGKSENLESTNGEKEDIDDLADLPLLIDDDEKTDFKIHEVVTVEPESLKKLMKPIKAKKKEKSNKGNVITKSIGKSIKKKSDNKEGKKGRAKKKEKKIKIKVKDKDKER